MTKQKFNSTIQIIMVTVFSFLFVTMISYATTIGTNISTGGTLAVTGTTTLGNASTTQLSVSDNLYTALTANSIPYITTSGLLTEDNSNLVWDSTNNRMGIGTSSPYAKLSIHANNGETNTTLFNIASSTASATTSLFTVLNNGNVGIGTDAPQSNFAIHANAGSNTAFYLSDDDVAHGMTTYAPTNVFGTISINDNTRGGINITGYAENFGGLMLRGYMNSSSAHPAVEIRTGTKSGSGPDNVPSTQTAFSVGNYLGSISYFSILGGGNIGIGTTSPLTKLSVQSDAGSPALNIASSTGASMLYVNENGNVGIGTASPSALMDMHTSATTTIILDSSATTQGACLKLKKATTTGYIYCIATEQGTLSCSTTSCE